MTAPTPTTPAPMSAEPCAAPFPNECCATEGQCIGRAAAFALCKLRLPPAARDLAMLRAVDPAPAAWSSFPNSMIWRVVAHIDALTARIAELERTVAHWQAVHQTAVDANETIRAELAAARKPPEDGEVARSVMALRAFAEKYDIALSESRLAATEAVDLLTRLSAALKFERDALREQRTLAIEAEKQKLLWENTWTAWQARALAAEAKLETARRDALDEAAKVVEGQDVSCNHIPENVGANSLAAWLTDRDFKAAAVIRALQKDTAP